jgi:hypothetical protein
MHASGRSRIQLQAGAGRASLVIVVSVASVVVACVVVAYAVVIVGGGGVNALGDDNGRTSEAEWTCALV